MSKKSPSKKLYVILDMEGTVDVSETGTFNSIATAKRFVEQNYAEFADLAIAEVNVVLQAKLPKIEWHNVVEG